MTDSYEIMNSVSEWLNIIEMKKFVDDGILLQMKITLIICQHKNSFTTWINGDFIQISNVLIPCHWENILISSKRCLFWNDYIKELEKYHTCLLSFSSTNSWHWVHLLHGGSSFQWGNWQDSWRSFYNAESQGRDEQSLEWMWDPLLTLLWKNLRRCLSKKQFILLQIDRLQLTSVYFFRRGM